MVSFFNEPQRTLFSYVTLQIKKQIFQRIILGRNISFFCGSREVNLFINIGNICEFSLIHYTQGSYRIRRVYR